MKYKPRYYIRKIHRYFGLLIGIQFIFWTLGGLYFSWTNIDEIHGDHFKKELADNSFIHPNLFSNIEDSTLKIKQLELRFINKVPYLWINREKLINAKNGEIKDSITKNEAIQIANEHILPSYEIEKTEYLTKYGSHHEYRNRKLPAWVISYKGSEKLKVYISAKDGGFQRIRYDSWRFFDFLWMMHTMDYQGRDNINNWILRVFSVLGLITILSGFALYFNTLKKTKKGTS